MILIMMWLINIETFITTNYKSNSYFLNECDLDWPLCSKDDNYRHEIIEFIIHRQSEKAIVIENYCWNDVNFDKIKKDDKEKDKLVYYSEICIEKRNTFVVLKLNL